MCVCISLCIEKNVSPPEMGKGLSSIFPQTKTDIYLIFTYTAPMPLLKLTGFFFLYDE